MNCKQNASQFEFTEQMDSASHKECDQSSQIGDDSVQSIAPDDALRGGETTYRDITDNGVPGETATSVKGENIYSEIPPSAIQSGGGTTAMDSKFKSTREPGRGGQAAGEEGERLGKTAAVPPEEALYEQPVGQPNLYSSCNYFKLPTNCSCNCLQEQLQDLFTIKSFPRTVYMKYNLQLSLALWGDLVFAQDCLQCTRHAIDLLVYYFHHVQ
jgi:hypothetical protein